VSLALQVADALAQQGWAVLDGFLPASEVQALAQDARDRRRAGAFHAAGVSRGARHAVHGTVRGDAILWLEPPGACAAQQAVLARFEALRSALNRELQLALFDFECHYTSYPPGAFYRRHRDRLAGDERRTLSCILYLNLDWQAGHGGELRLYLEHGERDVAPLGGRLVAFLSERFEHEVRPAQRERLSLTGWFRRRPPGV
jgi:SM-20-related protein